MRNIAFINRPLALADPVPLTVAILMTTSLTVDTGFYSLEQVGMRKMYLLDMMVILPGWTIYSPAARAIGGTACC